MDVFLSRMQGLVFSQRVMYSSCYGLMSGPQAAHQVLSYWSLPKRTASFSYDFSVV